MDLIKELTKSQIKEMPAVNVGDTVKVHVKVKEGDRRAYGYAIPPYRPQEPGQSGMEVTGI